MMSLRRLLRALVIAYPLVLLADDAAACPFCTNPDGSSPIHVQVAENAVAALVEPVESLPTYQEALRDRSFGIKELDFRVVRVLRGHEAIAEDELLTIKALGFFPPDAAYLLTSSTSDLDRPRVRALSQNAAAFLEGALALPVAAPGNRAALAERLRFMLGYLNDKDASVATAAYAEFADAPYDAVKSLSPALNPETLMEWIKRPAHATPQYGFLFLLVGLSGAETHAAQLWDMRNLEVWEHHDGLDGLLSAYIMLEGTEGLDAILAEFGEAESRRGMTLGQALFRSLRFHRENEDVLPRKDIVRGLEAMLGNRTVAYLAVNELKQMEAWASLPEVIAAYRAHGAESTWLRQTIRTYLEHSPKPAAAAFLKGTMAEETGHAKPVSAD